MYNQVWVIGFLVSVGLFQLVAIPAMILKKNDLADVLWGPAFFISSFAALLFGRPGAFDSMDSRIFIMLGLLLFWSVRLFLHVGLRNLSKRAEDVRYNNWRKQWGSTWVWRSYLQVFVLQALILFVFLSPVLLAIATEQSTFSPMVVIGAIVSVFGLCFESIADDQLRRFKKMPSSSGKLMTTGLWAWSRHPNYFGEVLFWWGIWLSACDLPYGFATIVAPIGLTYLILKVSGVSMLEDLMKNRPGFEEYARRTSEFIPRPPRS